MSYYFRTSVYILLIVICLCFMAMTASAQNASDQVSTLTVDAGQRGATIEKTHYGIFFEEINHAGDGGLNGGNGGHRSIIAEPMSYDSEGRIHFIPPSAKGIFAAFH